MPARCLPAFTAALVLATGAVHATAAGPLSVTDALQVLADLTLIDGACPGDIVDFGIGFRFATGNGVVDTAVMPGGSRRAEFEAVLRARRASFDRDELCGEIAENYAEALPGSVTVRAGTGAR